MQHSAMAYRGKVSKQSGCIYRSNFAAYLKLTQHYKSTRSQYNFLKKKKSLSSQEKRDPRAYHSQECVSNKPFTHWILKPFFDHATAYGMLVAQPGIRLVPLTLEAQSLNR